MTQLLKASSRRSRRSWFGGQDSKLGTREEGKSSSLSKCFITGSGCTHNGLRHTQATALEMSYIPVALISQRLGHSEISTTENIYTHALPNKDDITVDVIQQMLSEAKKMAEEIFRLMCAKWVQSIFLHAILSLKIGSP